jgi:hypothetical protein
MKLNGKASSCDLLGLIGGGLISGADAAVCESASHFRALLYRKASSVYHLYRKCEYVILRYSVRQGLETERFRYILIREVRSWIGKAQDKATRERRSPVVHASAL